MYSILHGKPSVLAQSEATERLITSYATLCRPYSFGDMNLQGRETAHLTSKTTTRFHKWGIKKNLTS